MSVEHYQEHMPVIAPFCRKSSHVCTSQSWKVVMKNCYNSTSKSGDKTPWNNGLCEKQTAMCVRA